MTNLIAIATTILAVTSSEMKTNVTESAFSPAENRLIIRWVDNSYYNRPPADEKWITTTVEQVNTLRFDWLGKTREVIESTLVSSNTVHLKIKQEWEVIK